MMIVRGVRGMLRWGNGVHSIVVIVGGLLCRICIDHHHHISIVRLRPCLPRYGFLHHVAPMSHVDVTNHGTNRSCNLPFNTVDLSV